MTPPPLFDSKRGGGVTPGDPLEEGMKRIQKQVMG